MLTCRDIAERASSILDADLPWHARLQARMHLLACRHCRRYVDQMAQTLRLLSAAVADPPEPPLEAQIAAQLVALSRTGVTTGQTRNGSAPGD